MPDLFRRRSTAGRPWRPALDRLLRRSERGQALVEFALITPLLLVLLLGTAMIGITSAERIRLEHAASEATVAGALEPDPAARCVAAERAAAAVLGRGVEMTCHAQPDVIEVRLSHQQRQLM